MNLSPVFLVTALVLSAPVWSCSEAGKRQFKLDAKVGATCAKIAQDLALSIGNATHPQLKKNEDPNPTPHSPFKSYGLDPNESKQPSAIPQSLVKTEAGELMATFTATISSEQGKWECLYCVTFQIREQDCHFRKAELHHCAGGVVYPPKR